MIASPQRLITALLGSAAFAFAGCGGGASASRSRPPHEAAPNAHSGQPDQGRRSPSQLAADRALGAHALLRLADFPAGWTASVAHPEPAQPKLEREVAACLHAPRSAINESDPAEVRSPNFKHSGGAEISNSVTVTSTPAAAAAEFSVFARPETAQCLRRGVEQELRYTLSHAKGGRRLPTGVSFGRASVEPMSFPPIGDQSVAYRVAMSISSKTVHLPLYFDTVLIRAGRAEISLSFAGVLLPTSPSTELALSDLTIGRLDAVLGMRGRPAPTAPAGAREGPI